MKDRIGKIFKWDFDEILKAILGNFLFAFAINIFIVPNHLYNGGILGVAQLLRTVIVDLFGLHNIFDFSGILNLLINIPLFILAYRKISKTFFGRTLLCVLLQTLFLTFIPTLNTPLAPDLLTNVLIGGILAGVGSGMVLSTSASGGGTDIIGILISMKNRNLSVGKIGLIINVFIYAICGFLYGLEIMIYSIIYMVFMTLMIDRTHDQNICSTAIIFTKEKPDKILNFVKEDLDRSGTCWEGTGLYDHTKTYVLYVVLSKYELQRLERNLHLLDSTAFLVKSDGVGIDGNFQKRLTS